MKQNSLTKTWMAALALVCVGIYTVNQPQVQTGERGR